MNLKTSKYAYGKHLLTQARHQEKCKKPPNSSTIYETTPAALC